VVDEAHRLNEKSGLFGNLGTNQIQELIGAAKCSIFFLDEDQRSPSRILENSRKSPDLPKVRERLSPRLNWPRNSAAMGQTATSRGSTVRWGSAHCKRDIGCRGVRLSGVHFARSDASRDRGEKSRKQQGQNGRRLLLGLEQQEECRHAGRFDSGTRIRNDLELNKGRGLWMVAPESVNEIGCIHTCQGLEVDYIG